MSLSIGQLRKLLKQDDRFNPFSTLFDGETLRKAAGKHEDQEPKAKHLLHYVLLANELYKELSAGIYRDFEKLGLNKDGLRAFFFAYFNKMHLQCCSQLSTLQEKGAGIQDLSIMGKAFVFEDENGQAHDASAVMENHVDLLALILQFIAQWPGPAVTDGEKKHTSFDSHKILEAAGVILVFKEMIYYRLMFDQYYIIWGEGKKITLKSEDLQVELVRKTGLIRNSTQVIHRTIEIALTEKSTYEPLLSLLGAVAPEGEITIQPGYLTDSPQRIAIQIALEEYRYIDDMPLPAVEGVTLRQLGTIFLTLLNLTAHVNTVAGEDQIPLYYDKATLVKELATLHDLTEAAVNRFIELLTADLEQPYFWRYPFYLIGDKLFIHLTTLTQPNITLYFDNWLRAGGLSEQMIRRAFKEFLIKTLNKNTRHRFEHIPLDDKEHFNDNILFELDSCALLIEVLTFDFTVKEQEYEHTLQHLAATAETLKEKTVLLDGQRKSNSKIITCILTNHPIYSGLNLNDVPIVDYRLINNYVKIGEYNSMALHQGSVNLAAKAIAAIPYYKNAEEFSNNLEFFIQSPTPVMINQNKIKRLTANITPLATREMEILLETLDLMNDDELKQQNSDTVDWGLYYKHYISQERNKEAVDNTIQFHLSTLFHKTARAGYIPPGQREQLLDAVIKSRSTGISHLNRYITENLNKIDLDISEDDKTFDVPPEVNGTNITALLKRVEEYLQYQICLPEVRLPELFTPTEEKVLISFAVFCVQTQNYQQLNSTEIQYLFLSLAILYGLRDRQPTMETFYNCCATTVMLLNYSHMHEKARNLSEEVLQIAVTHHQHAYAWNILFHCYTMQENIYQAAMYGCLYFTALMTFEKISYSLMINGYSHFLIYLRNFDHYEEAVTFFKWLNQLKLKDIDRYKITGIYFNLLLKNVHTHPEALSEIYIYLDQEVYAIVRSGIALAPWLAILYQISKLSEQGYCSSHEKVPVLINILEEACEQDELDALRDKIYGAEERSKSVFIEGLMHTMETRNVQDYTFEAAHITYLANHMIRYCLKTGDTEGILLSGLVLNDPTFSYPEKERQMGKVSVDFNPDPELKSRLNHYQYYVLSMLTLKNEQLLLWLLKIDSEIICLTIDSNKHIVTYRLPKWDLEKLTQWTFHIRKFHFNADKIRDYDLAEQEKDYAKTVQFFAFASLPELPASCTEVLVCFSTDLASMPHNLLITGNQFAGKKYGLCNIMSIENLLQHHRTVTLYSNCTMAAWIPSDDGNHTIAWGLSQLEPVLQQYGAAVTTTRYPDIPLHADINIFLAHGIREFNGFKVVSTGDNPENIIVNPSKVFGKGRIAVLFICNSGSSMEEMYGHQIVSFSGDLLKAGYDAVVAPYWPYDVTMSRNWLQAFINSLHEGYNINESVYLANQKLSTYDPETSQVFYAPQGCLAMHLYGNPNIIIK